MSVLDEQGTTGLAGSHRPAGEPRARAERGGSQWRLASRSDIQAVFAAGRAAHGSAVTVHARMRGDAEPGRAAVVAARRLGGAVVRNRAKRRLRAALTRAGVPAGLDVVLVARPGALTLESDALSSQLGSLIRRVGAPETPETPETPQRSERP